MENVYTKVCFHKGTPFASSSKAHQVRQTSKAAVRRTRPLIDPEIHIMTYIDLLYNFQWNIGKCLKDSVIRCVVRTHEDLGMFVEHCGTLESVWNHGYTLEK